MHEQSHNLIQGINTAAATLGIAAYFEWVPTVAGLFSIVWLGIQIYEYMRRKLKK